MCTYFAFTKENFLCKNRCLWEFWFFDNDLGKCQIFKQIIFEGCAPGVVDLHKLSH